MDRNLFRILFSELLLQILLDDVKVSEQLLDMVFYLLIVCGGVEQVLPNTHFWVLFPVPFVYAEICFHIAEKP